MHIKTLLIFFFFAGQNYVSLAQTNFDFLPEGAYRNIFEFRSLHPFYTNEIVFSRNKYDTTDQAYYIKTYNKAEGLNKKTAKEQIFAIYQNDDLYLNCYRFSMGAGFAKVLSCGRYSYFNGCGYYFQYDVEEHIGIAVFGGLGGYPVNHTAWSIGQTTDYIFDLNSGNLHALDSTYVRWILEPHFDLLNEFEQEKDKESFEVLLQYVELLNERSVIEISE